MFHSLARRILLYIAALFLISFALIFLHTIHEGGSPSWQLIAGTGIVLLLVLLPVSTAMLKSDDYLVPSHALWFFITTAGITGVGAIGLLAFFSFSSTFPQSYLFYFGIAPAGIAVIYGILTIIRCREAYGQPRDYRPELSPISLGVLPLCIATPALFVSGVILALSIANLAFEPQFDTSLPERPEKPVDFADRRMQANDLFQLAKIQQRQDHYRRSFELFRQAAEYRHPEADYEMALIYIGDGYLRNLPLAYEHFQKASSLGHREAAFRLGRIYRHGELGVAKNPSQARHYLEIAAEAGHLEAQTELGHLYNRGEGVNVSPEKAFEWFLKAAKQGDPIAKNDVGIFYLNGNGTERNVEDGLYWITKAAEQGTTVAQYNLALALHAGELVPQDYELAFVYFSRLAEKGIPIGFRMMGFQYLNGEGVERNEQAAFSAFSRGAMRRDPISIYQTALCYLNGIGTVSDSTAAISFLETAASMGHAESQLLLGQIYLEGGLVLQDKAGAATFFKAAADNGLLEAREALDALTQELTPEEQAEAAARFARFLRRTN